MAEPVKTEVLNGDQPLESLKEALPVTEDRPESSTAPRATSAKANPLLDQFRAFAKFGDPKADGKSISLSQSDKWMKQAKVIDGKKITATDTGIYFKKHKTLKLSFPDYKKFLEELAKAKKVELEEILEKMTVCGPPGVSGTTSAVKTAAVDRLTDSGKYTGSHKLRFDGSGRGRGVEGRKDVPDASGYVSGYANKDTYDKSH